MSRIIDDPARDAALIDWIERIGGGTITDVRRVNGGAYRTSCRVVLRDDAGAEWPVFLKIDLGSAPRTPFDLQREYLVLDALAGRARAPGVLGYESDLAAMAMLCLPGTADYGRIENDGQRERIERSFVEALVEVHGLDLASLSLAHLPSGLTIADAIDGDLDLWRRLQREGVADPDPITLFALAWCTARRPVDNRPAVLVQGDAGPGNFLFAENDVTGLVDWEMAHVGHPLEDIGCVLARSLVSPMASADRLLALYCAASGAAWTRDELLYATILVMTRFSVPISLALESRHIGIDYGLTNGYFRMSQISLLRLIAQAEGIALDETVPERGIPPRIGFEIDYLRGVLGTIIRPAVTDEYARYRLDGAIGLLGYLGATLAEQDDPSAPQQGATRTDFAAIINGGGPALGEMLQTMLHEALNRERLMREMLGPLHGRRIAI